MPNSWDDYYSHYNDWDEAHCFNVRVELEYEEELKKLGYSELSLVDDFYMPDNFSLTKTFPQSKTFVKSKTEIVLSYEVPYDWSIDTDWEDKALLLLGLKEEWIIDSSVEDS